MADGILYAVCAVRVCGWVVHDGKGNRTTISIWFIYIVVAVRFVSVSNVDRHKQQNRL